MDMLDYSWENVPIPPSTKEQIAFSICDGLIEQTVNSLSKKLNKEELLTIWFILYHKHIIK